MKKMCVVIFLFLNVNRCCNSNDKQRSSTDQIKKSSSSENLQNARIVSAILGAPDHASPSDLAVLYHAWSKIKNDIAQALVGNKK
jgi:hypothetical protein